MMLKDQIQYRIQQLNIAEKIILINVICFVLPLFFKTILYLFNIPSNYFIGLFELSSSFKDLILSLGQSLPMVFYIQDFFIFFGICIYFIFPQVFTKPI